MATSRPKNGLVSFATHANEPKASKRLFKELAGAMAAAPRAAAPRTRAKNAIALDYEGAARRCLDESLASNAAKAFVRPVIVASARAEPTSADFKLLGVEAVPLTGTVVVKFRQTFNKVPVYGSLVTVELDEKNRCLGINASLGRPNKVSHIARKSPHEALAVAAKGSGHAASSLSSTPRLYYYFHAGDAEWHLSYIIEDVPQKRRNRRSQAKLADSAWKDYVVDAHSGRLLAALPRTPTATSRTSARTSAKDGLGRRRRFTVEGLAAGRRALHDATLKVSTYDFAFKDPTKQAKQLPGQRVELPPKPWPAAAVSAHANAEVVAAFLRDVLQRDGIDNLGGKMVSSVNCVDRSESDGAQEWGNAFFDGDQMVYGQIRYPDGSLFSIANMLDIVAHEMFHGVTDATSRLEYQTESGALNESYSDILGVIVANYSRPLSRWVWKVGEGFEGPGAALRDLQDPTRHQQPKHMKQYRNARAPYTYERNDYGWVHDNSGIHNFAAYRLMTAQASGRYLFRPADLAKLFYVALTVQLSRTSAFSDSRRAVLQAARSLFRHDTAARLATKIRAIETAFSAAGIQ